MDASIKPSEMTFADYMGNVELCAEAIADYLEEDPSEDPWETLHSVIDGDRLISNHGYRQAVVMLSNTDPDNPDYTEPWTAYFDVTEPSEVTASDVFGAMAYVCYYNDVAMKCKQEDIL